MKKISRPLSRPTPRVRIDDGTVFLNDILRAYTLFDLNILHLIFSLLANSHCEFLKVRGRSRFEPGFEYTS